MRAVLQRCTHCRVLSDGEEIGRIGKGLLIFLGIRKGDSQEDVKYLVKKIIHLRIFEDEYQKLNLSLLEAGGELMIVSQFTLYGDVKHGRRPSFTDTETPVRASELYEYAVKLCRDKGISTKTGRFQTDMQVELVNDGPVTILMDSEKKF